MNWRRGLLLAGIHLVVAGSLLAWQESEYWQYLKSGPARPTGTQLEFAAFQEEPTMSFNPCVDDGGWDGETSPQERISGIANLPVALLTGWHEPCGSPSSLDSMVEGLMNSMVKTRFHRTRVSEIVILVILCALVAAEWMLVGGFPLMKSRQWWLEPGVLITICTLVGSALATIPHAAYLSGIPSWVIACLWLWWFSLLVWKTLLFGWRMTTALRAPRPN